jgi:hypothetical protein
MLSNLRHYFNKQRSSQRGWRTVSLTCVLLFSLFSSFALTGCSTDAGDQDLTNHTHFELVDWHVSGLWVINCPVAWIRVANYNPVPIKNITFQYDTYDVDGVHLDRGTYTVEETVDPGAVRNFIELYLGLVNLHSDKLSVKIVSVDRS